MSDKKDTNIKEPKFNEAQAYEELRMIFVIAIETQNFNNIEAKISAWESKYPLADFTDPEIVRKIKTILNKDFLSRLLGDYLATKVLHEKEKQKQLYDDLKIIIESAKKSKDYKSAQKQIITWKSKLAEEGLSLYDFDRFYKAKVCTLLLVPSKELKNQDEAMVSLKQIKDNSFSLSSEDYSKAISDWQNKYSLTEFPEELKNELTSITADALKSISEKANEETAIREVQEFVLSNLDATPIDSLATILSKYDYAHFSDNAKSTIEDLSRQAVALSEQLLKNISSPDEVLLSKKDTTSTQFTALNDLKSVLNNSPHDTVAIVNWIFTNRKIKFSQFARDEIIKQFTSVGYKIPSQENYVIPHLTANLSFAQLEDVRKSVICNYLGIISQGNSLSKIGKDNISEVYSTSSLASELSKSEIILPVFDTVSPVLDNSKENNNTPTFKSDEEDVVYNIFSEELVADPLITVSFQEKFSPKVEQVKEDVTVSPQIEESEPTETLSPQVEEVEENFSTDEDLPYSLTLEDQKNVENIENEITYVAVAYPILQEVFAYRQPVSRENKFQENSSQKNNGF